MKDSRSDCRQKLVYLGLGSNLADPKTQITAARGLIDELTGVEEVSISGLFQGPPMGPQDQPDYANAVIAIRTSLTAHQLLTQLQMIEHQLGRTRDGQRWGPRTIDLDILLYGDDRIATPDLVVPHIGIAERAFVLYPLAEIAPDVVIPGKGRIEHLLQQCPKAGLHRIDRSLE